MTLKDLLRQYVGKKEKLVGGRQDVVIDLLGSGSLENTEPENSKSFKMERDVKCIR